MKTNNQIGLKISFEYISGNQAIFELIKQLANKNNIRGYLEYKDNYVTILASSSIDNIQKFSKELGDSLPYSIFMSEATTNIIEPLSDFVYKTFELKVEPNIVPVNLSICPNCLKELFDENDRRHYFPFISCNYCGFHYSYLYQYPFIRENTVYKFFQMCNDCKEEFNKVDSRRYNYPLISCHKCLTPIYLKKGNNEKYGFDSEKTLGAIDTACGIIQKGNLLRIYTSSGEVVLGVINEENIKKINDVINQNNEPIPVLFTGFEQLKKYLILTEYEIKTIASQEKPVIYAKPSDEFKEKGLISPFQFVLARLPDEPLLLLLCAHLRQRDINYLLFVKITDEIHKRITEYELGADLPVINPQEEAKVMVLNDKRIIERGEKGILPTIIKTKKTGNLSIADDYAALDLGNGEYLIDRKEKILNQLNDFVDEINIVKSLNGRFEHINVKYKNFREFYDFQGAILSVLAENKLIEEETVGVYFSHFSDNNLIGVKTKTKPLTPIIAIKPIRLYSSFFKTLNWMLFEIKNSSSAGKKLIEKFSKLNPEFYRKILYEKPDESFKYTYNITAVLNAVSLLLEITDNVFFYQEPYYYLRDMAISFKGKKGVKIDYYLEEIDGQFYLDWIKIIQSLISYKLAGTERDMLAFSVLEGLGDWLIAEITTIMSKLKINNLVLAGDFFTDPLITGKLINYFSKNYNVYVNRRLPVDYQNIALGGIFA